MAYCPAPDETTCRQADEWARESSYFALLDCRFLIVGAVFYTEVMGLGASHFALLILFKTMPGGLFLILKKTTFV